MARKRMIDPSLWTDEGMADLTPRQQLLYIGMFSTADDYGRLKGSAAALALALPTVFIGVSRSEIEADRDAVVARMSKLQLYRSGSVELLEFSNYRTWQTINKPTESKLPPAPIPVELQEDYGSVPVALPLKRKEKNRSEKKGKEYTPDFLSFWGIWPKKGDTKSTAFDSFDRLSDDDKELAVSSLPKWLPYWATIENRIIPNASTWLNQSRWENDPPPISNGNGRRPQNVEATPADWDRDLGGWANVPGVVIVEAT